MRNRYSYFKILRILTSSAKVKLKFISIHTSVHIYIYIYKIIATNYSAIHRYHEFQLNLILFLLFFAFLLYLVLLGRVNILFSHQSISLISSINNDYTPTTVARGCVQCSTARHTLFGTLSLYIGREFL